MFLSVLLCMGLAAGCLLASKILLHYFQLESYQFPGYFRTIRRNILKAILPGVCMTVLLTVSMSLLSFTGKEDTLPWYLYPAEVAVLIAGGFITGKHCSEKHAKKSFVYTPRVKRLYGTSFIILSALLILLVIAVRAAGGKYTSAFILFFPVLLPVWIAAV